MQNRIGCRWLRFTLLALIAVMAQTARADVHSPLFSEPPPGASRPLDHERSPGLLHRPRHYAVRQRMAAQDSRTTAIVRGYHGFLPLQGRQRSSVQAEQGSALEAFCVVYDGLCPESRRFAFPAGPARQLIVQTELTTQHYHQLTDQFGLDLAVGVGRYQGTSDQQHATAVKAQLGLSTPASHPLQHGLFFRTTDVSSTGPDRAQTASAKTATLGYRQRLRLSARLSSVLFGADDVVWQAARGQSSRQSGTADRTHLRLAQRWDRGTYMVRISTDWRSHHPPAGSLPGEYEQQTQMIDIGFSTASSSAIAAMLSYVHIRSVGISHARTRTRFSRPLLWQAAPQDMTESQTSLLISGAYLTPNIAPFLLLQEQQIHQSALALPGRQYLVSLGAAIRF